MEAPIHAPMSRWPVVDDCLVVGGIPLTQLAHRVGSTPFYAYDRRLLDERVSEIRAHFPDAIKLHYAMKANPMPALVCHMARKVDGLDVASGRELNVALDAGMVPEEISFAGPGKSAGEIAQAVAAGILLNVESPREVEVVDQVARSLDLHARIAVRVNPDFELKSSGMRMGGGAKQFGVDAEAVPALLDDIRRRDLGFEGFHIYSGSQNLRAESICEAQQKTLDLAIRLAASAPSPVRVLNIGGGLGIPYFPGRKAPGSSSIGAQPRGDLLERRPPAALPQARLVVELGRYLVGEAGLYVTRVVDRKVSRGQVFLVTDGGLNHHLAASGNFGQVVRKNYPVVIGNRVVGASRRDRASVVGPLVHAARPSCGQDGSRRGGHPGDLVVVFQSGAYGASASPPAVLEPSRSRRGTRLNRNRRGRDEMRTARRRLSVHD